MFSCLYLWNLTLAIVQKQEYFHAKKLIKKNLALLCNTVKKSCIDTFWQPHFLGSLYNGLSELPSYW